MSEFAEICTKYGSLKAPNSTPNLNSSPNNSPNSNRNLGCRCKASTSEVPASISSLPPLAANAHRFVLMRHGESEFNNANIFTGWCDVALTQRGVVEAVEAGQVFASHGIQFRKCYASMLTRSIVTAHRSLEAAEIPYTPIVYDWRLNERHYGALQGLSKDRTASRLGRKRVMRWRRSYYARPPPMTRGHPHYHTINNDPRYKALGGAIPLGESLEDCQFRVLQAWKDILGEVEGEQGERPFSEYSLLVAHANTLRALVMHLDDIPAEEIEALNIPTAIPFYYDIDLTTGKVLDHPILIDDDETAANWGSPSSPAGTQTSASANGPGGRFRGIYISDDKKKRNFLERRRAANDPWLWALYDHQVDKSMLVGDAETAGATREGEDDGERDEAADGFDGIEEEAKMNTELFSSSSKR
eukprot:CAMPEP_0184496150 /NCGR_PEP_ID=MMETSP0113_2-20130426/33234_1 /TAXON_ID=91329 /ORGANISM="Norrisiella sphaerica, Strain BC52" /LENGTH=414 /DNA_ID=CAMNT_0026882663 /DNA_START=116 /DNA_END=1359 /DNA_ORIENTATION=-